MSVLYFGNGDEVEDRSISINMAFRNGEPRVPCLLDKHRQGIADKEKHSRLSGIKEKRSF